MTLTGANNEYIKILKGAKDTDNESTIRIKIKQDDKMPGLGSREFELVISESSYPNLFIEMMNYMDVSPKQVVSAATACIPFLF